MFARDCYRRWTIINIFIAKGNANRINKRENKSRKAHYIRHGIAEIGK